jgi:hypothetical protein
MKNPFVFQHQQPTIQTISSDLKPKSLPYLDHELHNHRSRHILLGGPEQGLYNRSGSGFFLYIYNTNKVAIKNFVIFGSPVPVPGSKKKPVAKFLVPDWGI